MGIQEAEWNGGRAFQVTRDWLWAAALIVGPFMLFGLLEFAAFMRRRRERAIAQRPKHRVYRSR